MTLLYLFWGYLTWECLLQNHFSGDPRWVGLPTISTGALVQSGNIASDFHGKSSNKMVFHCYVWHRGILLMLTGDVPIEDIEDGHFHGFFIVFEPCQTRGDPDPLVFYCFWAVSSQKRSWCILRLEDDSPLKFLRLSGSKGQTVDLLDTYKVRSQKDS